MHYGNNLKQQQKKQAGTGKRSHANAPHAHGETRTAPHHWHHLLLCTARWKAQRLYGYTLANMGEAAISYLGFRVFIISHTQSAYDRAKRQHATCTRCAVRYGLDVCSRDRLHSSWITASYLAISMLKALQCN